jgi:hypothetical protein
VIRRALSILVSLVTLGCTAIAATPTDLRPSGKTDETGETPPAPRVELKVTVHPDDIAAALFALGLDPDDAEHRYVSFYDTPDLALYEAGLVLRSRKIIDDDDDSTVKLRPFSTEEAWGQIWWLFDEDEFKCEIDRTPAADVSSCSLSATQDRGEIDDVESGERDIDKLFSSEQEELVAFYGPEDFDWDDLVVLGPVAALRFETYADGLDHELTVELWEMPDGGLLLELSVKVEGDESEAAMESLLALIAANELRLSESQTTKTRRVLTFYAGARDDDA